MATSLLDLAGVLLIGVVGALSVTTIQSQPPPEVATQLAQSVGLTQLSDQELVMAFAGAAAAVLLTKSLLSSYLMRRVFMFLANRQALVAARLTKELLSRPLTFVQRRSSQETAFALITGAGYATVTILGHLVIIATEFALLFVLGAALLFLSPWAALGAIAFFALVAFGLQRAMGSWSSRTGTIQAAADIASLNTVQEAIGAYREISVSDRRALYIERVQELRWRAARVTADSQFIGMFPKYMFEAALVIGGFILAAALFATQDSIIAVGTLALFLAAATRVMPSILRLQGATLGLRGAAGVAGPTFALARDLDHPLEDPDKPKSPEAIRQEVASGSPGFAPSVQLEGVSVTYPGSSRPALRDVTLTVTPGLSVALVGRSGAGKSTLADVILGVLEPASGTAQLGGLPPTESVRMWPGGMAYVPQDVILANGTIRENVALGLPRDAIDDDLVWQALSRAHFANFLAQSPDALDMRIGENGIRLSGGQRQRLGIARALYTRPRLLVMDEATSALDAETEEAISQTIDQLEGEVTTIIVAHRLSTVKNTDLVVYLEDGRIEAAGSFAEVLAEVPAFAKQAKLMGLVPNDH